MENKTENKTENKAKKLTKIVVEREIYEKDGTEYFAYFVKGNVRGREVKASVVPQDFGGYTVLDIVFNDEKQANIEAQPFEIKDDKTGAIFKGVAYIVSSVDENGEIYECRVKAARPSDKYLLAMILR